MVAGRTMMRLTPVQDQAIAARMAVIVGSAMFDRLFAGVHFDVVDGDILFVYALDEDRAAWKIPMRYTSRLSPLNPEAGDRNRNGFVA
jgi:hypothetical protein